MSSFNLYGQGMLRHARSMSMIAAGALRWLAPEAPLYRHDAPEHVRLPREFVSHHPLSELPRASHELRRDAVVCDAFGKLGDDVRRCDR
jgi:hypothetical protein